MCKRGYRFCAGGTDSQRCRAPFVHSRAILADYDQQQVFFRPRESGCERALATRVEAQGAVKLKRKAQLV
jgi:hypothetical protein